MSHKRTAIVSKLWQKFQPERKTSFQRNGVICIIFLELLNSIFRLIVCRPRKDLDLKIYQGAEKISC